MSHPVLRVENLSKKYTITHEKTERYQTLRDALAQGTRNFCRRLFRPFLGASRSTAGRRPTTEEFWALRDASFEVHQGDRLGIIGRNGAGKSTLLKIMSRITEPTHGSVSIKGRVASLLEVGTGFHPELTGRENIFLNGAILGMSRLEIRRKFDEIVAFAEIERFLDTPVKRYSSGMYVRLAFAVAAHLEPEILLVDEVLAVGDAEFQKRCLGKMAQAGREGRTVLFVSHNLSAIQKLCPRSLLLEKGRVALVDVTDEVVAKYVRSTAENASIPIALRKDRVGSGQVVFTGIRTLREDREATTSYAIGEPVVVEIDYRKELSQQIGVVLSLSIRDATNVALVLCDSRFYGSRIMLPASLTGTFVCRVELPPLRHGLYYMNIYVEDDGGACDWLEAAAAFTIDRGNFYPYHPAITPFPVLSRFEWTTVE